LPLDISITSSSLKSIKITLKEAKGHDEAVGPLHQNKHDFTAFSKASLMDFLKQAKAHKELELIKDHDERKTKP
jgi:hypothetical protein